MKGMGKGIKGLGKGGIKRYRKINSLSNYITKPAARRLARRGGVKRISSNIYEEMRGIQRISLEQILRDAIVYAEHSRRKTVMVSDVIHSLRLNGRSLYGF